jgi:glycosyltransferase involved in cell wall biosynthesis
LNAAHCQSLHEGSFNNLSIRILFTSYHSYLDDSNGAAVASRAMMEAMARREHVVEAMSGTVLELQEEINTEAWLARRGVAFEAAESTSWSLDARGVRAELAAHYRCTVNGVRITLHRSHRGAPHQPDDVECEEFLRLYEATLCRFRPDTLVTFGGNLLAHELRCRARQRNVKVVFALHNFNYHRRDCFDSVDQVIVPSRYAARYYHEILGLDCKVLPNLIDVERARADDHERRYLVAVNPSYEKGVYVLARIADELGRRRPDIPLLIVEGRGSERTLVDCGLDLRENGNVSLMTHTHDPRHFWSVAKLCVMPSLWMENQPLVAIEAMVNGVPVIGSDRGGIPETLGNAGIVLPIPERITPITRMLPTAEEVAPWVEAVIRLWDDEEFYADHQRRALAESRRWSPEVREPQYVRFFSDLRPKAP